MGSGLVQRRSVWSVLSAWLYDPFLALGERRGMAALRRELLGAGRGRVLEVGAGTGCRPSLSSGARRDGVRHSCTRRTPALA